MERFGSVPISCWVSSGSGSVRGSGASELTRATRTPGELDATAWTGALTAAVIVADVDQRILHVQGGAFAAHGLDTESWVGMALDDVLGPDARPWLIPRYNAALGGEPQSFDYWTQDGERAYSVQMAAIRDAGGRITSVVAVMQDITDGLRVSSELARSEGRLREAERMVGVGSWEMVYATGEITFSPGIARLLAVAEGDRLDAENYLDRVHPEDRETVARAGAEALEMGSATCEGRVVHPDGTVRLLSLRVEVVMGADGRRQHLRGAVLDITEQRESERQRLAAEYMFREGFDTAPIGMALSDLDGHCLRVNDAMCRLLQRPRNVLVGQPMTFAIPAEEGPAFLGAREEMLTGRADAFKSEHRYIRADGATAWGLMHVSPVRREDGSIEAFHSQLVDITERKEREARLEHDVVEALWLQRIRDALDQDRLVLYDQPIVDLLTGQTVQHELLLRMSGEDGSVIAPGEFLPAAERYGLISEIDRWVIRQAVQIAAAGTPTEFNLSGRSIADPNIVRELAAAIQDTGVDPSLLVVEVTETAFAGQHEVGREFAKRVRELGCRLALDDFGTGFSSLSYLKHLPADHLKIDLEFVRDLTSSETDARVIRGIVGLAREFNQTTIAEGVEDEATLLMLREMGVDQAQGFLFGAPAPHGDAPAATEPLRRAPAGGVADPTGIVRTAFEAFAQRNLDRMLKYCHPDLVLRTFATSTLADRGAPYRGHGGLRTYLRDVETVWDELTLTPLTFRATAESVICFGRVEGRRPGQRVLASVLWVVGLRDGLISSIEVFQAVSGPSLTPSQMERLRDTVVMSARP
jgi:PAS domain S-box-containing protein